VDSPTTLSACGQNLQRAEKTLQDLYNIAASEKRDSDTNSECNLSDSESDYSSSEMSSVIEDDDNFFNDIKVDNTPLSIAYHKRSKIVRIYKNFDFVTMDTNSLTTLAYTLTPFISMMQMGIMAYIADLMPKLFLGEDVWLEMFPPLDTCIIRDKINSITINMEQLVTLHGSLFKPAHRLYKHGVLGPGDLPCIFTHNTMEGIARCKVCGGKCWFGQK
jgi:hypothetical protein